MKRTLFLCCMAILLLIAPAQARRMSDLSIIVGTLGPGQWAQLPDPANWNGGHIGEPCYPTGGEGIVEYTNNGGGWDTSQATALFVGTLHGAGSCNLGRTLVWDEATNTITSKNCPAPCNPQPPTAPSHAYGLNAFRESDHTWFFVMPGTTDVYKSTDKGTTWTLHSGVFGSGISTSLGNSLLYFPEAAGLVYENQDHGVWFCADSGTTWVRIANAAIPNEGPVQNIDVGPWDRYFQYDNIHGKIWYGGGTFGNAAGSNHAANFFAADYNLYRLDADLTFHKVKNNPHLANGSVFVFTMTDPVSGHIIQCDGLQHCWAYNTGSNNWYGLDTTSTGRAVPIATSGDYGAFQVPVDTYGIVLVFDPARSKHVWAYKHDTTNQNDATGPTITSITVASKGNGCATVNFTTGELALSFIEFGTSTSYGLYSTQENFWVTGHGVTWCNGMAPSTLFGDLPLALFKHGTGNGMPSGTLIHFRIHAMDMGGHETITADQTFTTPSDVPQNFTARCATTGVVRCVGFDNPSDISGQLLNYDPTGIACSQSVLTACPTLDGTMAVSGASSLKFVVPPTATTDTSGLYYANFKDDWSKRYGPGQEFWVQYRVRFDGNFLDYGKGGWKGDITSTGDTASVKWHSCEDIETPSNTQVERYNFYAFYNSCSRFAGLFEWSTPTRGGSDYQHYLNAVPSPGCTTLMGPDQYFSPGTCFSLNHADEWFTLLKHFRIGPRVAMAQPANNWDWANSYVQVWMARQGQPYTLVLDYGPVNLMAGVASQDQQFGKIWLTPYNTSRVIYNYSGPESTPTGSRFYPPYGSAVSVSASSEGLVQMATPTFPNFPSAPIAGVAAMPNGFDWRVTVDTALGTGSTAVFTFRDNAVDTAKTCTITGASQTFCDANGNNFNLANGHNYSVKAVYSGTAITGSRTVGQVIKLSYPQAEVHYDELAISEQPLNVPDDNPVLHITTGSPLPNGTVGTAYSLTIGASAGTPPYGFAVTGGSLPAGLSLAAGGALTGTPTTAGASSFTITVTDNVAATASKAFSLTVDAIPTLQITTPAGALANGTVGSAYSQSIGASGGVPPYTFQLTSGSLPTGLSLAASTGIISGTPSAAGTSTFGMRVQDSVPAVSSPVSFNITINASGSDVVVPTVALTSPGNGATVEGFINATATASDNVAVANVTFTLDGNLLGVDTSPPYNLSYNITNNALRGPHTLSAVATDTSNNTASSSIIINIVPRTNTGGGESQSTGGFFYRMFRAFINLFRRHP